MNHIVYTDGGCYNNGTPRQEARICVFHGDKKIIHESIGNHTSNEAEFIAIERAYKWITANLNPNDTVEIRSDSKLAVNMIGGTWRGKLERLKKLRDRIKSIAPKNTHIVWIGREKNLAGNFLEFSKEQPDKNEGMLNTDRLQVDQHTKPVDSDFVSIAISSKDGYSWKADGNAGMVVIRDGNHSEVDMIGTKDDMKLLLATALIKVRKMLGKEIVDQALDIYNNDR